MAIQASQNSPPQPLKVALLGNPNCGKTTVFNALTGLRQKVGNYPGVTVERKEGVAYTQHGTPMQVIDLPGTYSLHPRSPDEQVLVDFLLGRIPGERPPDVVVCLIDASNIERNLFFVTQVVELGFPTIVALNMLDVAERRGIRIKADVLERKLGVKVVELEEKDGKKVIALRVALSRTDLPRAKELVDYPELVEEAGRELGPSFQRPGMSQVFALAEARLALSANEDRLDSLNLGPARTRLKIWRQRLDREMPGWQSGIITARYAFIGTTLQDAVQRFNPNRVSTTERFDKVLLHPVAGFGVFALVMGVLFYSVFKLAVPLMDLIDGGVGWLAEGVAGLMPDGQLESLIVDGVIGGIGGVVVFLPQILMLFFFISLLESSGYMARAAFILDRVMSKVGLHGRSFVPLLSSYACAVPGIMATRTIESPKDRLVTIMVAPFMSCSARLPVYLILIAALLPEMEFRTSVQALLLFGLYFTGTAAALIFGLIFKRTLLKGVTPTMVLELPSYQLPRWRSVGLEMWDRSKVFLRRAGTVIFALSILLWFGMNYPQVERTVVSDSGETVVERVSSLEDSFAGRVGKAFGPLFSPLGYDWRVNVGVLASFGAREVFVSTMAIICQVEDVENVDSLLDALRRQTRSDGSPLFTPLTCLSLMFFFVFALQCMSTVAVVRRETQSWRWALFQVAYMFAVAWLAAFSVYQGGLLLGFR